MFDVLSTGFKNARLKLQGKTTLDERSVSEALREVRSSLIQADVGIDVVKAFLDRVKERALGNVVTLKASSGVQVTAQDHFIKACYDELVDLMGPVDTSLSMGGQPTIIMLVGLQGSGKTTTAGKLAKMLLAEGRKPLLVAADIYRPAAIDQLMVIGRTLSVPVFSIKGVEPVKLSAMAVEQARSVGRDVVIIDTAGRLAINEELMVELEQIKGQVRPQNILFVVDAMIGQDAVQTAKAFHDRLSFDGFVLTKLDGDARGGAALSIKAVTGRPVKFLGQGEDLDRLEVFRPDGLAQRILGFGDVVGLMQDFERHVDQETAEKDAHKMLRGDFSYEDFVRQLQQVRRMGPMRDLLAKLPMMGDLMSQIPPEALDDRELDRTMAIIGSMTRQERRYPDVLNRSRFERVARGCGRPLQDVEALHERFVQARQMLKGLGGMMGNPAALAQMQRQLGAAGGGGGFPGMFPGFGGMPGAGGAPGRPAVSVDEKLARRKKQKEQRKARKKNRR
jgi:signal recognition particle subunit SRP54